MERLFLLYSCIKLTLDLLIMDRTTNNGQLIYRSSHDDPMMRTKLITAMPSEYQHTIPPPVVHLDKDKKNDDELILNLMMLLQPKQPDNIKQYPKPDDIQLLKGTKLKNGKYVIDSKLDQGGFGAIFVARDVKRDQLVAVKCEQRPMERPVLQAEYMALKRLQKKSTHVCTLYASGRDKAFNYIIMSLCGDNLYNLRVKLPDRCYTSSTSFRLMVQIIEAIEDVHNCGIIHRDIKPSNFAIGNQLSTKHLVYVLDFGLVRFYRNDDGTLKAERTNLGFRGTLRYASLAAHHSQEIGRHDDLWSAYYMFIEFIMGTLPWRSMTDKKMVQQSKTDHMKNRSSAGYPRCLEDIAAHLCHLDYNTEPDYQKLKQCVREQINVKDDSNYDWE